jgi:TfoX/Sxy family transcriptional regulator of competence genes
MFGGWAIYRDGEMVAIVYESRTYVKAVTEAAQARFSHSSRTDRHVGRSTLENSSAARSPLEQCPDAWPPAPAAHPTTRVTSRH